MLNAEPKMTTETRGMVHPPVDVNQVTPAPAPQQTIFHEGQVLDNTYRIVRLIGEGGMGLVYEATHARLAHHLSHLGLESTFVLESGETLVIDREGARKGESVTVGRVCIDSGTIDEVVEDMVIRDRRHLSEDGFVLPIVAINKNTGRSEGLPEIVSRGFMSMEESPEVMQNARQVVQKTLETSTAEERRDWGVMQEKIRADLKRYLTKQTSRRPLIMPVILEV